MVDSPGFDGSFAAKHEKSCRPAIFFAASCIAATSSGSFTHHTNRFASAVLRVEIWYT